MKTESKKMQQRCISELGNPEILFAIRQLIQVGMEEMREECARIFEEWLIENGYGIGEILNKIRSIEIE